MNKFYIRLLLLLSLSLLFCDKIFAQTITIRTLDPGPYGQGSTIGVPINIGSSGGCIQQGNTFNLYLSDANGSFTNQKLIGSFTGFYASYVNGVIPNGTPAGTGYRVRVATTSPATTGASSVPFTISASAGVQASVSGPVINTNYPDFFGNCFGKEGGQYDIVNNVSGATVTANFYNELSQTDEGTYTLNPDQNFSAHTSNYTIFVKTTNNGIVGTKAYTLLNNINNINFGSTSSGPVCLYNNSVALTYNVDVLTSSGIQKNYPGTYYKLSWGDGTYDQYTLCQIIADGGRLTHNYNNSSCGATDDQGHITNKFQVSFTAVSAICPGSTAPVYISQAVLAPPKNTITNPPTGCVGSVISFHNASFPGQTPNSTAKSCNDASATYSWFVDGVRQPGTYSLTQDFKYTFTTNGIHKVTLRLENSQSGCGADDYSSNICIQNTPQPAFTVPSASVCALSTVSPVNQSITDDGCAVNTYAWHVTGPGAIHYTGGTDSLSKQPQWSFTTPGTYKVTLGVIGGCGQTLSQPQNIYVDAPSTITMAKDTALCGTNQTISFDPKSTIAKTLITGTTQPTANTYNWTVTGGNYSFANGTTANSQYPSINFTDFGTYTVTATAQNYCGPTATASQKITFQSAPTVTAGTYPTICANTPIILSGASITPPTQYTSVNWTGGKGTFSPSKNVLNPTYTPSADEIKAGSVTLALNVTTGLSGSCSTVTSTTTINIYPANTITSAATAKICTNNPVGYTITSSATGSTYTWTATVTSGSASGFTTAGTGNTINDILVNNDPSKAAVVTYSITPQSNGCNGTPFSFAVTVMPKPVITATAQTNLCSGSKAGITLTSNVAGTQYTWTSTVTGGTLTGNTNQSTPATATAINDVLVNSGNVPVTVTYTITPYTNSDCSGSVQTVTITVQPSPITPNAGVDQTLCNQATATLKANDPSPYTGSWSQVAGPAVTIVSPLSVQTNITGMTGGNVYKFVWTIKANAPCTSLVSNPVTITDKLDNVPSFTADVTENCGSVLVNFTNTSTSLTANSFTWNFGDGTTATTVNASHTFAARTDGKDAVYTVTLNTVGNCIVHLPATVNVVVHPKTPTANIIPQSLTGCSPFTLRVNNLSPGTNTSYTYYLYDGSTLLQKVVKADTSQAVFAPINTPVTKTYTVYMVATNACGTSATTKQVPILVQPADVVSQTFALNNVTQGCVPFATQFVNNATGGNSFYYTIYDSSGNVIVTNLEATTDNYSYVFKYPGTYYFTLTAVDACSSVESPKQRVDVFPIPLPQFNADVVSGCKTLLVHFTNTTPDASNLPASTLNYLWDFGDGTTFKGYIPPAHLYTSKKQTYDLKLIATNPITKCADTLVQTQYISVFSSPGTQFKVLPDSVITYPDYHFSFSDQTTGKPLSWAWDFGDGHTSTLQNPEHSYADTGYYKVTLTTNNQTCDSTVAHYVRIQGTPGQLYLPNAFMPNSGSSDLKTFYAKGSGIKEWHLQIFNNYGQLIWETTKLSPKGEPVESWDGTFKGTAMPQGVYVWQASATFINGMQWKGMSYNGSAPQRKGVIHLLR